ncbi:MAG: CsbD family protein [Cyanophyceae cyanobacterium]
MNPFLSHQSISSKTLSSLDSTQAVNIFSRHETTKNPIVELKRSRLQSILINQMNPSIKQHCDTLVINWFCAPGSAKNHTFNQESIMGIQDRAKATGKDIEGKIQDAAGKLTDDRNAQAAGKAKQAEAKVRHAAEDIKDDAKDAID